MQSLFTSVLVAQLNKLANKSVTTRAFGFADDKGTWEFRSFEGRILKASFHPAGYTTNELTSNAVILKPDVQKVKFDKAGICQDLWLGESIHIKKEDDALSFYINEQLVTATKGAYRKNEFHSFAFRLLKDEKIFGGGERALPLNRRGHSFNLYNSPSYGYENGTENLNFSIPFFSSSNGYGIFFDNPSRGYADIGKSHEHILEVGFVSGELNFYIITGRDINEIVSRYTKLTGRQPMPPRWVFGNFMSRFGYRSEQEVREVYALMKKEGFPMDAVIFDLFWFGDSIMGTMGNLDWTNKSNWPDPKKMIGDFLNENVKTILITEPFILESTANYIPSQQYHSVDSNGYPYALNDFYFGRGGLIDIFRADAQDWFWTKYQQQVSNGVAGWWGDLGEPERHPSESFHDLSDLGFNRKFASDEVHNLYGHYWSKMLHEKYAKCYPGTRLFHLNRSGFAGSQRYSVFPWTGDVHRSWSGFKAQLSILLGMSLSGIPYIHSDAGGFAMGEKDPELYTRWLQFAAFTPVFRPHGTAFGDVDPTVRHIESEPVFYPEPFKSILRQSITRRYELSPYNYTLAYEQHVRGKPLMRPMFYHFPEAENYDATSQYMWGEHLLIAPVLDKGATEKKLYLPKGSWFDLFNNSFTEGGEWMNIPAGIDNIPVFAREGAFIPTVQGLTNLDHYSTNELNVLYVPSANTSDYFFYDDDGRTPDPVIKKQFELLHFSGRSNDSIVMLSLSSNGGKFNGRPAKRNISFRVPGFEKQPSGVLLNGVILYSVDAATKGAGHYYFDKEQSMLHVNVAFTRKALKVQIKK